MTGQPVNNKVNHIAVLKDTVMDLLHYGPEAAVVDATVGHAGHARALAERLGGSGKLIGLDVDSKALAVARERLTGLTCATELIRENFGNTQKVLQQLNIDKVDVILADLGINSAQLADPQRGIGFQIDGPLDMRLSGAEGELETTAEDIVNKMKQEDLANLIFRYGQERKSRRIARAIVYARKRQPIKTTFELAEIVARAAQYKRGPRNRIHPATRTFQALRIAVNDELGQLERLLKIAPEILRPQGYIAIISFHSLEDGMVKWNFRENKQAGNYDIITKKPLVADEQEKQNNPRSRSAKLRVAQRRETE